MGKLAPSYEAIVADAEAKAAARAASMPTEKDAINAMFQAWLRLKELGWKDSKSAPADCRVFASVECGSSGVHETTRDESGFWVFDGDLWPSHPVLWREWRDTDVQVRESPCGVGSIA